ncbi:CtrA inhibitor SciP [Kiloniella sp. b19]|uniref:CtrA inhibitor SciP n=1 Tax=Kiloniella sp. GXU_MW_B19 TaxID=3141326 RepID=UPI0031E229BB
MTARLSAKAAKALNISTPKSLSELPPPSTKRWVIRRKAEVVLGVHSGLLSLEEACERYQLSQEEFQSWETLILNHGLSGLRTTRLQQYRSRDRHPSGPQHSQSQHQR